MGTTAGVLVQRNLNRRLMWGKIPLADGVATGGGTTSLVHAGTTGNHLLYSSGDSNFYDGMYVYHEGDGEVTRVTRGGYAGSTGTLTLSGTSTGFASSDLYQISDHPSKDLQDAINDVLRNVYTETFYPLSLIIVDGSDNGFDKTSNTSWLTSNTALTRGSDVRLLRHGTQYGISTISSAAGGFLIPTMTGVSGQWFVNEDETYYTAVDTVAGVVTGGPSTTETNTLQIFNDTAGSVITGASTTAAAWTELSFQFTVPSSDEVISARLRTDGESSDVGYWDDWHVWSGSGHLYPLPDFIEWPEQIIDVRGFPRGTGGPASDDDYRVDERQSVPLNWHFEKESTFGVNELYIWVEGIGSNRPYIIAKRAQIEMSTWTTSGDTTTLDPDIVTEHALELIRNPEQRDHKLALLRHMSLAQPTLVAPRRVGVR